jgi:hypothetical protein
MNFRTIPVALIMAGLLGACAQNGNVPDGRSKIQCSEKSVIRAGPVTWHVESWTDPGEIPRTRASVECSRTIIPLGEPDTGMFAECPRENWSVFHIPPAAISAIGTYYAGAGTVFYAERSDRGSVVVKAVYHDEAAAIPPRSMHKIMAEFR